MSFKGGGVFRALHQGLGAHVETGADVAGSHRCILVAQVNVSHGKVNPWWPFWKGKGSRGVDLLFTVLTPSKGHSCPLESGSGLFCTHLFSRR